MSDPSEKTSWFTLIGKAIRGGTQDLTKGNLNQTIIFLAVPMIIEMFMEAIFAIVDIYWVGRLGVNAQAIVALTESMMMLMFAIAIGLSMATTAVVARRIGEKNTEDAAVSGIQSIGLAVIVSIVFAVIGISFPEELLQLMGAEPEIVEQGKLFTQIAFGGNLTVFLLFLINAIFRGVGNASIAMKVLTISNGINLVLDPLFIFGLGPFSGFGVEGAAIATLTGRSIGVAIQLYFLIKGTGVLKIAKRHLVVSFSAISSILKIAFGSIGQFLIGTSSWIFLTKINAEFGTEAVAGYSIAQRIIMFTILPAWGLSNAGATLVGQNLGAKNPDRAEKAVWTCAKFNLYYLGIVTLSFLTIPDVLVSIFTESSKAIEVGSQGLRHIGFGFFMYSYSMALGQAFNGAGDSKTPTIVNLISYWVFQIPLAYSMGVIFELGPKGIFSAISISIYVHSAVTIFIFRKGKWKTKVV